MKRRGRTHGGPAGLIALLLLLTAVPLATLTFSTVHLASDAMVHDVEQRVDQTADLAAAVVQEDLRGVSSLVSSFAEQPELIAALHDPTHESSEEIGERLRGLQVAHAGLDTVLIIDPLGSVSAILPANPPLIGSDVSNQSWYLDVTAVGRPSVSAAFLNPWPGDSIVVAVAALVHEPSQEAAAGKELGTLVALYDLDEIRELVEEFSLSEGVEVTVTDQGGSVVVGAGASRTDLVSRRSDPGVAAALGGNATVVAQGPRIAAYVPVQKLGWTISAGVGKGDALSSVWKFRSTVYAVAGMLAVVLAAGLLLLTRALRDRRRAEREATSLQSFLESVIDNLPNMLFVKDADDLSFVKFNRAGEELLGYPREQLLGKNDFDLFPQEEAESFTAKDREVLESGRLLDIPEEPIETREGPRILHTRKIPILDEQGRPRFLLGISEDITDRKRMEDAVRESEERYRLLVENAPDMVFTLSPDGVFTSLNSGFETITGWKREDWIGKSFAPLVHPDDLDAARRRVERILRGEQLPPFQLRLRTSSGGWRNVESVSSPLVNVGSVVQIVGIVRDVTERKLVEDALRASEERTRLIIETASDAVIGMDTRGRITDWNRQAELTFGWSRQEAVGRGLAETIVPPQYREAHLNGLRRFLESGQGPLLSRRVELSALHRDGREFPVELTVCPVQWGPTLGFTAFVRDITERKRADEDLQRARNEAERAKDEAERANRAKSEFLSRMSHELRTPLNAVLGFGQLLEMDSLDEEQRESVGQILKGGRHLLDLINEVLDIARIEVGRIALSLEPVAVGEAVLGAVDLIRPLAAERGIRLGTEIPDPPGYVTADRQRLKQILLNLLSNAVKYNRPGGSVTARCLRGPAGMVRVEVADDGPGIAPEYLGRLFMPFERLGAESSGVEGTGLGLALSKRLVEVMGGTLGVDTVPGRGSTFSVALPAVESPEARFERDGSNGLVLAALNGEGTLLHIEDNPANLKLIERILSGLRGVKLLSAMQGTLGLDLARQHRPDVILLDLNLPDMQGHEVLGLLRADPRTKDIPVLVVSADATPEQLRRLRAAGARAYLTKPLDIQRFLQVVDEALRERRLDHAG